MRTIILRMKGGERDAAAALGALLAERLEACAIVPVPTTRARIRERGFDQTRLILECAARHHAGLRVHALLEKCPGAPQHGRARTARLTMRGRFRLCRTPRPAGSVVLFDDVMTTGASLMDAAATLAEAGVRVGAGIVIARAAP